MKFLSDFVNDVKKDNLEKSVQQLNTKLEAQKRYKQISLGLGLASLATKIINQIKG